jgi:ribose transport system substrate-binding protein
MKKHVILALLVVIGISTITACSNSSAASEKQSFIEGATDANVSEQTQVPNQKTIALVMKTLTNPFFAEMEKGARKAESEFRINLLVKTAAQETSIEQQIEIVQNLIRQNVDAIVIAPGDSKELIPVLKKARDAGIVVVNIDNRLDPDLSKQLQLTDVPYISVDNKNGAYLSAKVISDKIHAPAEAAILEGIRDAQNAQDRKAGADKAFSENPNITIVASETANWKIDEAHDVAKKMFTAHPNIKLVFCANDMMALGLIQYLDESGKKDVLVASYDALEEARQAIKDGKLTATIDQQASLQGYTGVAFAVKMLHREQVPAETLLDVLVVTAGQQ